MPWSSVVRSSKTSLREDKEKHETVRLTKREHRGIAWKIAVVKMTTEGGRSTQGIS